VGNYKKHVEQSQDTSDDNQNWLHLTSKWFSWTWLDGWDAFEESYNMSKPYLFGKWSKMDLQSFIRHQKITCIRICLDDVRYGIWNLRQNRKQTAESSLQDTGDWFTRPWTGLKADHPMFNLENQSKKYRMFVCM